MVDDLVREGWTWGRVAEALGVTRQAVHKKHARRLAAAAASRGGRTSAKEALKRSQAAAKERGDRRIGSAHVLLGAALDGEPGAAAA